MQPAFTVRASGALLGDFRVPSFPLTVFLDYTATYFSPSLLLPLFPSHLLSLLPRPLPPFFFFFFFVFFYA
jgi:hypothetical protein